MNPASLDPVQRFQVDALEAEIYARQELMAEAAARAAQTCLQSVLEQQKEAAVILGSAVSQIQFLQHLVKVEGIDWARVTLFHMDEYLGLPAEHPANLGRFIGERVANLVKPRVFHRITGDALEPLAECERYTRLLQAQPIDLCCLGVGENGHIAFNDPAVASFADRHLVKIVKLDRVCRMQQVGEGAFPNLEAVPQYALTLTVPALCGAKRMLCIVPEKRKAKAIQTMLQGPVATGCPASILRRQPQATLYLDADAASLL